MMTIIANLNHAYRIKEFVNIGGGTFSPEELRDAAQKLQQRDELLAHLQKSVASLEWAAAIIGDMSPKCEYLESLREAKEAIAKATRVES